MIQINNKTFGCTHEGKHAAYKLHKNDLAAGWCWHDSCNSPAQTVQAMRSRSCCNSFYTNIREYISFGMFCFFLKGNTLKCVVYIDSLIVIVHSGDASYFCNQCLLITHVLQCTGILPVYSSSSSMCCLCMYTFLWCHRLTASQLCVHRQVALDFDMFVL